MRYIYTYTMYKTHTKATSKSFLAKIKLKPLTRPSIVRCLSSKCEWHKSTGGVRPYFVFRVLCHFQGGGAPCPLLFLRTPSRRVRLKSLNNYIASPTSSSPGHAHAYDVTTQPHAHTHTPLYTRHLRREVLETLFLWSARFGNRNIRIQV